MSRPTSLRNALTVVASSLVTFSAGVTVAVLVATSASAAAPKSPAANFFVINGTVNAASIHVVAGSSAFPNFANGAFDNYYTLAHSRVDNSPSAEGRASPFDSGPIGQTAAAGNFQQPQYAEARWPGRDSGSATYGKPGEPYANAEASEYKAKAEASGASRGSSGPGAPSVPSAIPVPKELDNRLRQALAEWKATWLDRLAPGKPADAAPTPKAPPITTPVAPPVPIPKAPAVPTPKTPTVTTPVASPPPAVPAPPLPAPVPPTPPRSLAAVSTPAPTPSADGGSLLESSTLATLDGKTLVTSGESTLGRVSLGGGQIVIRGIRVSASVANDGSPSHKVAISVAGATIGGVPVTIDEDGVQVAGKGNGLPYQAASDALNGALERAGIEIFLVAPQVKSSSCAEPGADTSTQAPTPLPAPGDQSGTTSACPGPTGATSTCEQPGTGTGSGTGTGTTGTGTTTTTSTSTTPLPLPTPPGGDEPDTSPPPSSCGGMSAPKPTTGSCVPTGTATGTTTSSTSSTETTTTPRALPLPGSTTTTTESSERTATSPGPASGSSGTTTSGQRTVRATGVHVVFNQPVNQSGVPAQNVEYILGEVFVDSLAVPAGPLPDLGLASSSPGSSLSSSACPGGGATSGTGVSGGASMVGGSSAGALSPSGSGFGSASPAAATAGSASGGTSLPAAFAAALRKPLWLLLSYLLWQALVIGTGVSLWNWRRGEAA